MTLQKFNLSDVVEGVPAASRPVYWDTEMSTGDNLDILHGIANWHRLDRAYPEYAEIDEAAIMVPTPYHRDKLGRQLSKAGWSLFNKATDLVHTNPFGTRYLVEYQFFSNPGHAWRLEIMMMDSPLSETPGGFSPLHASLYRDGRPDMSAGAHRFPVPHLSYKAVPRVLRYPAQVMAEAGFPSEAARMETPQGAFARSVDELRTCGYIHAQTCQSSYGLFGYYIHQDADRQIYIKPRVNLRDAACGRAEPCGHNPDGGNHPVAVQ